MQRELSLTERRHKELGQQGEVSECFVFASEGAFEPVLERVVREDGVAHRDRDQIGEHFRDAAPRKDAARQGDVPGDTRAMVVGAFKAFKDAVSPAQCLHVVSRLRAQPHGAKGDGEDAARARAADNVEEVRDSVPAR